MRKWYEDVTLLGMSQDDGSAEFNAPGLWGRTGDRIVRLSICPVAVPAGYMIQPNQLSESVPNEFLDIPELSGAVGLILGHLQSCCDWRTFAPHEVRVEKGILDALVARGFLMAGQFVTYEVTVGLVHDLYLCSQLAPSPPTREQI